MGFRRLLERPWRLSFGEYWGLAVLVSLFFWRTHWGVKLGDCKLWFMAFAALFSLACYGIPKSPLSVRLPVVVILGVSFLGIYNASSPNAITQWLMITAGGLVFLQAWGLMDRQGQETFEGYMALACMALSMSVLLSGLDANVAAPYPVNMIQTPKGPVHVREILGPVLPGALGHQGMSGMFIAITLPFAAATWAGLLMGLSALAGIAYMGTSTPLVVALAAVVGRQVWKRGKMRVWAVGVAGLFATLLATLVGAGKVSIANISDDGDRFRLWGMVGKGIAKAPFLGHGPGVFRDIMAAAPKEFRGPSGRAWDYVCNEYLEGFFVLGGVGMLAVGWLVWTSYKGSKGMGPWALSALIVAGLSLTWFPFHIASTAFVAIIILAILSKNGGSQCELC